MELVFLFVMIIAFLVIVEGLAFSSLKKRKKSRELELRKCFYKECKKNKIYNIDTEINKQRAIAIANNLGIKYGDITDYFNACKSLIESETKKQQEEYQKYKMESLKEKENDFLFQSTRFAEFVGRDKRIAMLLDNRAKIEEKLNKAISHQNALYDGYKFTQTKEKDWAIAGGIASGLAGPAAGIATAMDIQAQNAQIRERNAQNRAMYDAATLGAKGKVGDEIIAIHKELEEFDKNFEKEKIKLVSETPKEKVFEKLSFDKTEVSISETGAFKIKTFVSGCKSTIFDKLPAVVDGTIVATLYQNNIKVGDALLVLPEKGISTRARKTEGICICNADKNIPYEIKFAPYHLWEIEE